MSLLKVDGVGGTVSRNILRFMMETNRQLMQKTDLKWLENTLILIYF